MGGLNGSGIVGKEPGEGTQLLGRDLNRLLKDKPLDTL